MKGTRILLAIVVISLLAGLPLPASAQTFDVTSATTHLHANGTDLLLKGVNDQTVVPLNFYPYPAYNYRYTNHVFPYYWGEQTKIPNCANYTEFWWKYFSEVKALGLNHVRLGGFDAWGLSMLHKTWHNNRTLWDSIIDPMFSMANLTGVYLTFCFGGSLGSEHFSKTTYSFSTSASNPTTGSVFVVGTETYNELVSFIGEVMTEYANRTALFAWDLMNEPNADAAYNAYWKNLPSPTASYISWASSICASVMFLDHSHLIYIGGASGEFFGWGQTNFDRENVGGDLASDHEYFSVQDNYLVTDKKHWANELRKPLYFGEAAKNSNSPPWVMDYWPWFANICANNSISVCWMTLDNYPGYPITNATLNALPEIPDSYWPAPALEPTPAVVPENGSSPTPVIPTPSPTPHPTTPALVVAPPDYVSMILPPVTIIMLFAMVGGAVWDKIH